MKRLLLILLTAVLLAACGEAEESVESSEPDRPGVKYSLFLGEAYGAANDSGFSFRVIVPEGTDEEVMREIVDYEVYFTKYTRKVSEFTYFVYVDRDPRLDSNWTADYIFEWRRSNNQIYNCTGLTC